MTQQEKFLQFLRAQQEREISEMKTSIRVEGGDLVITKRYQMGWALESHAADSATEPRTGRVSEISFGLTSIYRR